MGDTKNTKIHQVLVSLHLRGLRVFVVKKMCVEENKPPGFDTGDAEIHRVFNAAGKE